MGMGGLKANSSPERAEGRLSGDARLASDTAPSGTPCSRPTSKAKGLPAAAVDGREELTMAMVVFKGQGFSR
jgi:hypothetical protein